MLKIYNTITDVNRSSSANRTPASVHISWFNINNDIYVNAWRCAKCAQAECEKCDLVVICERFKMYAILYTFFIFCVKLKKKENKL